MRILIADDSPQTRRSLRSLLGAYPGWTVCAEARNGAKAIFMAKACKPDIVVLDFVMPVMNGLYAAREIARVLPGIPILLQTLCEPKKLEAEAKRCGVTHIMPKQYPERLLAVLERLSAEKITCEAERNRPAARPVVVGTAAASSSRPEKLAA